MRVAVLLAILSTSVPLLAQAPVISLSTKPTPLLLGQNRFEVTVTDAKGRSISDADVIVAMVMPAMPAIHHPEMRSDATLRPLRAGTYSGIVMVTMAGSWNVQVTVRKAGRVIGRKTVTLKARERVE